MVFCRLRYYGDSAGALLANSGAFGINLLEKALFLSKMDQLLTLMDHKMLISS